MATFNITKRAFARERLTVTNAVKTLTASVYNDTTRVERPIKASAARIQVLAGSGQIQFTEEGTAPTADVTVTGVGTQLNAGDILFLESYEAIKNFKAIRVATDAILEINYYR